MKLFLLLYLKPILCKWGLKNDFFDISKFCLSMILWTFFQTSEDIYRYKKFYLPNALRPTSFSYLNSYCGQLTLHIFGSIGMSTSQTIHLHSTGFSTQKSLIDEDSWTPANASHLRIYWNVNIPNYTARASLRPATPMPLWTGMFFLCSIYVLSCTGYCHWTGILTLIVTVGGSEWGAPRPCEVRRYTAQGWHFKDCLDGAR